VKLDNKDESDATQHGSRRHLRARSSASPPVPFGQHAAL